MASAQVEAPLSSLPSHDAARRALVDRALTEVGAALYEVLDPLLRKEVGDNWFEMIGRPRDTKDDAAFLLWIMTHDGTGPREEFRRAVAALNLGPSFFDASLLDSGTVPQDTLDSEPKRRSSNAHELKYWRNAWAHQRTFSAADTYRVMDCAHRLLRSIGDDRRAAIVQVLAEEPLEHLAKGVGSFSGRFPTRALPVNATSIAISWNDPPKGHLPTSFRYSAFRDGGLLDAGRAASIDFESVIARLESTAEGPVVIGLAYALSVPWWVFGGDGFDSPDDLWSTVTKSAVSGGSLTDIAAVLGPPWWGEGLQTDAPPPEDGRFRLTEDFIRTTVRTEPKSAFELTGTGNVGALSLAGMVLLSQLRDRGYTVWPFEGVSPRTVVETFPRALGLHLHPTPVSAETRQRFITSSDAHEAGIGSALAREMQGDFRLLDAVMTAWALDRYAGGLKDTAVLDDARTRLEGQIWLPG